MSVTFTQPKKLVIKALDGVAATVTAQYNPKEIGIDKSVPWNKHENPQGDVPMLEFTSAENRSMSLELFFDFLELPGGEGMLAGEVASLLTMTKIKEGSQGKDRHPPRVMVVFGMGDWFRGVIESLGIKYTMFNAAGMPVRATATLKIKEVDEAQAKEST